jgi:hypothetical protein
VPRCLWHCQRCPVSPSLLLAAHRINAATQGRGIAPFPLSSISTAYKRPVLAHDRTTRNHHRPPLLLLNHPTPSSPLRPLFPRADPQNHLPPAPWSSSTCSPSTPLAGACRSTTATIGKLLSPSSALLRPPRRHPSPSKGSPRVPHAPPPIPHLREAPHHRNRAPWAFSVPKIATRDPIQQ